MLLLTYVTGINNVVWQKEIENASSPKWCVASRVEFWTGIMSITRPSLVSNFEGRTKTLQIRCNCTSSEELKNKTTNIATILIIQSTKKRGCGPTYSSTYSSDSWESFSSHPLAFRPNLAEQQKIWDHSYSANPLCTSCPSRSVESWRSCLESP